MKNTVKLFGIIALAALIGFAIMACSEPPDGTTTITWEAEADGVAGTTTSTKITFTFSESVTGLSANDITITNGTGSATKGALTGSGTTWNLAITDVSEGIVSVKINKDGISSASQNVTLHKSTTSDITWALAQVGGVPGENGAAPTASTTAITITFSGAVSLTEADIHIGGAASHDSTQEITSSGNVWTVPVTVTHTDNATVTINKEGIEGGQKTVLVYKQGEAPAITWTATADGTEGTADSTKITFTFSEAINDLEADDITLTNDNGSVTKGTLTGNGTTWELGITVTSPGFVTVAITKTGISAIPQEVSVYKAGEVAHDITWAAVVDGEANTTTSTKITFTFSAAVHDLTGTDITLHNGTGTVTKGELSGSGTSWELGITVETAGTVSAAITKAGISAAAQNVTVHKGTEAQEITWTAAADGALDVTTSTKITITFSSAVSGLEANDITITNGTGAATKTGLTYNAANSTWELGITVQSAGTVSVDINKAGIVATAQDVTVHKAAITWSAEADGSSGTITSTKITFTFSEAVSDLEASNITVNSGTGTASKSDTLTGSGTSWELGITIETQGTVSVSVTKAGVSATAQLVDVFKLSLNPITNGLTTYINTMDQLVFNISGTYALNSPQSNGGEPTLTNGKYTWRPQATGTWTWDEGAQTITLTVNTALVTGNATLVTKSTATPLITNSVTTQITGLYESTYEDALWEYTEYEYGPEEEAEEYAVGMALDAAKGWHDVDGDTLEEIIAASIAKELEAFDTRSYTYTHSNDGESLILLEPLPPSVGQDVLNGEIYYEYQYGMVNEDHSYTFNNGTYVEEIADSWFTSASTKSGAYSYNATTKRVYLKPATIDGVTPLQFYEDIDMEDVSNPYPTDADYRTATTHSLFRTTNNSYDTVTDQYTDVEAKVIRPRG